MFKQQREAWLKKLSPLLSLDNSKGHEPMRLVVLGVAGGKRIKGLQSAAETFKGVIHVELVQYSDAILQPERLIKALRPGCWLKIDSPGEDLQTQNHFIERGWKLQNHTERPLTLPTEFGELTATDDWYVGFSDFLKDVEKRIPAHLKVRWINSVKMILLMTDKWRCQNHLQSYNIPTPRTLGRIHNYDELKSLLLKHKDSSQVFIKSRFGSSASGVIAYRQNTQGKQVATSTATFDNGKVFNNKRAYRYEDEMVIAKLINHITQYGAYVEKWIPKPSIAIEEKRVSFDFRVVTLAGEPLHRIVRGSSLPMTNLHLDSQRIDPALVKKRCDIPYMYDILEEAASRFKEARIIGFDAICTPRKTWVLEANAFGDLLPDLLYKGQTTYEAQLSYILKHQGVLQAYA